MTDETKAPEATKEKPKAKMGRPSTLSPEWQALADKLGGVEKLCGRLGCAERTLRHWSSGSRKPSYPIQQFIRDLCTELRLREPRYMAWYDRPGKHDKRPNTAAVRKELFDKMRNLTVEQAQAAVDEADRKLRETLGK
jgi:hypothetical protein